VGRDKKDLLSDVEGVDTLELPISSRWNALAYECAVSGVELNKVEGMVDASDVMSLYVSKDR
jgi:hypothetical protein